VEQTAALDRNMPLYRVQTLNDQVRTMLWQQRAAAGLITSLGAFSLLIASVGLYSVMANAVAHRTREIGIRVALGAEPRDVRCFVVRDGMVLAGLGTILGTAAALAMTRFLSVFLYGVSPTDPATFIWVALVLLAVSLTACYLPARAASRVDPAQALQHE
jgi:putative ABC transport system permease protein